MRNQTKATLLCIFTLAVGATAAAAQTPSFSYAIATLGGGFSEPEGVAVDGRGNVYLAEPFNNAVQEMPAGCNSSSCLTTLGGGLVFPEGVAVDGNGNVYVADTYNNAVKEMPAGCASSSCVSTLGGGFFEPRGVAVDGSGNVYVAEPGNNAVQEMPAGCASSSCVTALGGGFYSPYGVAVDGSGNVYVADYYSGAVTEMPAGCASSSCVIALGGGFYSPYGVAVDGSGNVYVADYGNNEVKEMPAGCASPSCVTALGDNLVLPTGVAVDGSGNVYVAGGDGAYVREVMTRAVNFFTVPVGTAYATLTLTFTFNSAGSLGAATPYQVLTQGAANLDFNAAATQESNVCNGTTAYTVGETCTVNVTFTPQYAGTRYGAAELLDSSGIVLATGYVQGTGVGPQVSFLPGSQSVVANAANNGLNNPQGVAVDGSGNVYIADLLNDRVLKETLSAGSYAQSVVANAATSGLGYPVAVAVDGGGNVYIADGGNNRVLKETPSAGGYSQSVIANAVTNGLSIPAGVAVDGSGNVYIVDAANSRVLKETLSAGSYVQGVIANAADNGLNNPIGVAVDGSGSVYIADYDNGRALKETLSAGGYTQSVIADGLNYPCEIALDGSGNVYIADFTQLLMETFSAGSYIPYVIASPAEIQPGHSYFFGVAVDGSGNVYISDATNSQVLKEDFVDPPSLTFATTAAGSTSSDSPQAVLVENVGNAPLSFPIPGSGDNPSIGASFSLLGSEGSACPLITASSPEAGTLAAGARCLLDIDFTPAAVGNLSESLALTDTNLNAAAPGYASQSIALSGEATQGTPTINWAAPPAITYGTAIGAAQLDANSPVGGSFVYSPAAGTVLTAGPQTLKATFTPTDTTDYTTATATVTLTVNQATPTINWPTPAAITYTTMLGAAQLDATSSVAGTFVYSPASGTVPGAGLQTLTVTFTPTDTTDYTTATATVTLTVNQRTPPINWATPAAISYGTALGAGQLDATSYPEFPGTFAYSPAAGTVLPVGPQTLKTTFTPTDTTDYTTATATVTLIVNQGTPTINWATPGPISYGTALGAAQLDATSAVAGGFAYSPAAGTVLTAGPQTLKATFTPTDTTDYTTATATVMLTVNQATPTINWPTPTAILYGTAIGAAQLDATSTVAGTFAYSPAAGTVLTAGPQTLKATFTPTDTTDYTTAMATVTLTVNEAAPTITWPTPAAITYGAGLGAAQLDATSSVAGSFAYSPSSGIVLGAGSQTLKTTFTPTDTTDYTTATASVMLTVNQATPTVTWATPAAIFSGTALSATQLDATASVPGTFAYTPALGTTPPVGNDTLSVTFTPTDNIDYSAVTATVTLTVNVPLNPVPFVGNITPAIANAGGVAFTITVNGSGFLANSTVYWGTSALTTVFVSSTQLTATVTAADIAIPGATAITVQTPAPGGGTSDVLQFEVDSASASGTAPTVPSAVVSVTAGSTATYSISFPASVTNATATCLNLPTGAICSFSFSSGILTISTSSTTPAGTYQVTVVFNETVSGSSSFILLPLLLLPVYLLRKRMTRSGMWSAVWLSVMLAGAVAFSVGCGGSSSSSTTTTTQTQSVTSSGVVGMKVQ